MRLLTSKISIRKLVLCFFFFSPLNWLSRRTRARVCWIEVHMFYCLSPACVCIQGLILSSIVKETELKHLLRHVLQ
jgi:hypothetical protein